MAGIPGRKIAVLATDGVEQIELTEPVKALKDAGAEVMLVAPQGTHIQAWNGDEMGDLLPIDARLDQVKATMFDALLLPGGFRNAGTLRMNPSARLFVLRFVQADKPIAAISYAPWILIEVDALRARLMTSCPLLRADLTNAGAVWYDLPVMVDAPIVTARMAADLPDFCREMVKLFDDPVSPLLVERAFAQRSKAERIATERAAEKEQRRREPSGDISASLSSARRRSPLPRPPARP